MLKSSLTPVTGSASREDIHYNKLKLPRLPLPEYGHKEGEDLNKFFTNFELIIDKYSLFSFEKFVFLQKQLSNEPLTLIKSLETGRQDYESAKELLEKAFASPLTQKYDAIRRLSEIKLGYNDDPYEFIGKMRMLTDSFKSLKIDANDVLQFFIWHGMNDRLQAQFVNITKCNKPSLTEINTHIFDATEGILKFLKVLGIKRREILNQKTLILILINLCLPVLELMFHLLVMTRRKGHNFVVFVQVKVKGSPHTPLLTVMLILALLLKERN